MSLLGTLGSIAGGLTGLLTGGPAGAVTGWQMGGQLGSGGGSPPQAQSPFGSGGGFNMPFPVTGPGGQTLPGFSPSTAVTSAGCPKGYHLNKHALAASKRHGALPAHSICVRNRHMHPLNSRAITRSLRRIKRASKIVRKLHSFSGPRRIAARSSGHRPGCGCVVCRRK